MKAGRQGPGQVGDGCVNGGNSQPGRFSFQLTNLARVTVKCRDAAVRESGQMSSFTAAARTNINNREIIFGGCQIRCQLRSLVLQAEEAIFKKIRFLNRQGPVFHDDPDW